MKPVSDYHDSYREFKERDSSGFHVSPTNVNLLDMQRIQSGSDDDSQSESLVGGNMNERPPIGSSGRDKYSLSRNASRHGTPRLGKRITEDIADSFFFFEIFFQNTFWRHRLKHSGYISKDSRPNSRLSRASSQSSLLVLDHLIVRLNVGGKIFATSRETLLRDKESMLAIITRPDTQCSGRSKVMSTTHDDADALFLDRDPTHFRYILNYLRDGSLYLPDDSITIHQICQEAEFFQVRGLVNLCHLKLRELNKDRNILNRSDLLKMINCDLIPKNEYLAKNISRKNTNGKLTNEGETPKRIEYKALQLPNTILTGLDLSWLTLRGAMLTKADMSECDLRNCDLENSILTSARLQRADMSNASLNGSNLVGADLTGAILRKTQLCNCDFTNACFNSVNLRRANLQGSILKGVTFTKANLQGCIFYGANLSGFDLSGCNLKGANLEGSNLSGTDLSSTNMKGCNLWGANLEGARLEGACLTNANLRRANMTGVIGDYET